MRVLFIALLSLAINPVVHADQVVIFSLNTSALSGVTGSIDFALGAGALNSQAATAQILQFTGASFAGTNVNTGAAAGGPANGSVVSLNNDSAFQSNDNFESVVFGPSLSFSVDFSGPAVTAPDKTSNSTNQFGFYTYSDPLGTQPAFTSDAGGLAGLVTINFDGSLTSQAISPQLTIAPAPEPATLVLLGGALGILGLTRFWRGRSYLLLRRKFQVQYQRSLGV